MTITVRQHLFAVFLIATTALFVGEGIYTVISQPHAHVWMIPIHLGVGAPIALLAAWLGALGVDRWRGQFDASWPRRRISAWLISSGILLALWTGATAKAAMTLSASIVTPSLAAWATALAGALLLLIAAFCAGAMVALVQAALERITAIEALSWMDRPLTWLIAAGVAVLAAIGVGYTVATDTFRLLPWAYVIGPASGTVAAVASHHLLRKFPDRIPTVRRAMCWGLVMLGLFAFLLPMRLEDARESFVDRPNLASMWKSTIHPALDFDGDGYLFFYAGGDCAPFNPDRGPHQTEVPNDGIDWNCSGHDLTVDLDDFHGGPAHVERPDGIADKPHVILVTTDALSHPHTSVAGYERDVTPNLADWAQRATVFESAFANSTSTRLAMPGLLASKMNAQMHLEDGRNHPYHYADHEETLATMLNAAGYRTVHIPGTAYFERWGGYWNGYDEIDLQTYANARDEIHTSPELTDAAIDVITEHDDETPLHLWVHYFDHHSPYVIPDGAKEFGDGNSNRDRFDSELHFADSHWGQLFDAIERRWDDDEYILVFTSDHGEAFDENHPREHHDFSVYTRPLHVPLIIQAPWGRGERVDGLTGHIDVLPTVANLTGTEPSDGWEDRLGETLVPALSEGTPPQKSVIYSLFYIPEAAQTDEDRFQMYGVRTDDWYFYENHRRGERRLVRWREDALDRNNFRDEKPDKFEAYRYVGNKKLEWLKEREAGLTHLVDEDE